MPTLVTDPGVTTATFTTQSVAVIDYLGAPGGWVTQAFLYCNQLTRAVNAIDEAKLAYEVGESVVQCGQSSYVNYQPLSLKGKFVRVTITTAPADIVWYGYCLHDEQVRDGVKTVAGVNKLVGKTQIISCVGLEYFLNRKQIDSGVVRVTGGTPDWVRVSRPFTFNGGPTADLDPTTAVRGNRSHAVGADGVYDFTDSFDGADLFVANQIVDHVLKHHTPLDSAGNPSPAGYFLHSADIAAGYLAGFYPTLRSEGITAFHALNKICSPTRGLVWWTEYNETLTPKVFIRIASGAPSLVSLPGGGTLPANVSQQTLDFDTELDVSHVKFSALGHRDFDQVVARGQRMTTTCTVGMPDTTIIGDWSTLTGPTDPGTEKKYKDASKNDADYGALSYEQQQKRNDAFRRNDAFYRVYSAFRIPTTWDGKTSDGGGGTRKYALPILSSTGSVIGGLPTYYAGLRMLNTLRLKRGWDYSNPATPKSSTPAGSHAELMPPFAFLEVSSGRFQLVDKLRQSDFGDSAGAAPELKTTYHVHMQSGIPGFKITASGGLPHALALTNWAGAEPSETEAESDYNKLRATVCLEADLFCEGKYPEAGFTANKPLEILNIELGEHYRLDFLAENTVVGLDNGRLVRASNAAVLRDDRKYLQDAAKMAFEWYRIDRNSLHLTLRQVRSSFDLGMLVTTMGTGSTQKNINTVVSSITYDLVAGTTAIETADETLDVRSVAT